MDARKADRMAMTNATADEHDRILRWIEGWYGERDVDVLLDDTPGQYAILITAMRTIPGYYPTNDCYGCTDDYPIYGEYEDR